ncbi:MAG TPA: adenylate/guanylate cyclase domain-containing protein, partial [Alphaproteobacteria bacterium]|nr:adenylate/guanylate cyclase domain-containing protein [Alphaproteobacteria bacterium]
FADLRGFTQLADGKLPYDIVFILNRYFAAMGRAVEAAGGQVDKFIGDGVMALFGLEGDAEAACRKALDAARGMAEQLDDMNRSLAGDLREPLRIGIGIHVGPAIVGEMGWGRTVNLTAIGDSVNTASRLEALTKEFRCQLVVSEDVARRAGLPMDRCETHEIAVRGKRGTMRVLAVPDAAMLAFAAAPPPPPEPAAAGRLEEGVVPQA